MSKTVMLLVRLWALPLALPIFALVGVWIGLVVAVALTTKLLLCYFDIAIPSSVNEALPLGLREDEESRMRELTRMEKV